MGKGDGGFRGVYVCACRRGDEGGGGMGGRVDVTPAPDRRQTASWVEGARHKLSA